MKALDIVVKDTSSTFVNMFINMGERNGNADVETASAFVCQLYGQSKSIDVNEARYKKLIQMSGKFSEVLTINYKSVNFLILLCTCK